MKCSKCNRFVEHGWKHYNNTIICAYCFHNEDKLTRSNYKYFEDE